MIINNLSDKDKYRLARYLYRFDMSPLSDPEYDALERSLKEQSNKVTDFFSATELDDPFETSYDDDTTRPDDLIKQCLTEEEKQRLSILEGTGTPITAIDAYVSKSMQSYRTLRECFDWVNSFKGVEFCVSPKIDGINSTTEYLSGSFSFSRTRGHGKNALDISNKMSKVLPTTIGETKRFIVAAEMVISKQSIEDYNSLVCPGETSVSEQNHTAYNNLALPNEKMFVTCRGSAMSILRREDIPEECTKLLIPFVFRTNYGSTLSEGLEKARALGFNVVPFETYTFKYSSYEEYEKELTDLIWKYKLLMESKGIPTDGLVLQVNSNSYFSETVTNTAYDGGNLAVKAVAWEPGIYTSTVQEIIMNAEETVQYNCKVLVEPRYTEDGKCLRMVNMYNVNTLISNNVHEGSIIEFEYVNETTINFKRKVS